MDAFGGRIDHDAALHAQLVGPGEGQRQDGEDDKRKNGKHGDHGRAPEVAAYFAGKTAALTSRISSSMACWVRVLVRRDEVASISLLPRRGLTMGRTW